MRDAIETMTRTVEALRPHVEAHVTTDRVRRYLSRLVDTPAPSTAAGAFRLPVLKSLLDEDGALGMPDFHLHDDFEGSGSPVMLTGAPDRAKPLWYFAHLDTISYLILPKSGGAYPLVPFCYHLIENGTRPACAFRFDLAEGRYGLIANGELLSVDRSPTFHPAAGSPELRSGDRVVPHLAYKEDLASGDFTGHMDNAGGVAALALAAPLLAAAGIDSLLALPDEEEGPPGTGSQVMGRGGSRIVGLLAPPEIAIVADVQQAGDDASASGSRLGSGAVLAESASLARGAVTPPHLYVLAERLGAILGTNGAATIQTSGNSYNSRSDDVSLLLKTPNILLLGFPGFDRHFDRDAPRANLHDVANLAKALVYFSALVPAFRDLRQHMSESAA